MKNLIFLLLILLSGCHSTQTFFEAQKNAKYKIGQTVTLSDDNFYAGCKFKIKKINYSPFIGHTEYVGTLNCVKGMYSYPEMYLK